MKPPARLRRDEWDYWTAQHLLNRAGFGGTPAEVRGLTDLGLDGAVDYIVDYDGSGDRAGEGGRVRSGHHVPAVPG